MAATPVALAIYAEVPYMPEPEPTAAAGFTVEKTLHVFVMQRGPQIALSLR